MGDTRIGNDLSKWYITRPAWANGRWYVCPPMRDKNWNKLHPKPEGATFATGAEALAAFAAADAPRHLWEILSNCPIAAVEPWHGRAVTT